MKLEEWIDLFNTTKPFIADEIAIFILSKLLGYGIAIILQNTLWTTTQGDDMMGCDVYFTYCGKGNFVPLKHYNPADEDELLKKYCLKKAKEKEKKKVGGRAKKVVKVKGNPLQFLVMTHSQLEPLVVTHSPIKHQRVQPRRPRAQVEV